MIAIPFVAMLAAVCLGVAMSGTYRNLTGQQAHPKRRGRHERTRRGDTTTVITFGSSGSWKYRVFAQTPGGATDLGSAVPLGLPAGGSR